MHYPYNTIFGRGLLNIFEAAFHSAYLCLKILAPQGVLSILGSQKEARNIEQSFAPGHKNVHFLREDPSKDLLISEEKEKIDRNETIKAIKAHCETKRVSLDPEIPNKSVLIGDDSPKRKKKN